MAKDIVTTYLLVQRSFRVLQLQLVLESSYSQKPNGEIPYKDKKGEDAGFPAVLFFIREMF